MASGERLDLRLPLRLLDNFNFQTEIPEILVRVESTDADYRDRFMLQYNDLLFDVHTENQVVMSYASNGTMGFLDPFTGTGGRGFIPRLRN
ncbi:hypothetical protein RZS08_02010, partial [Arthrospira platensis SPKY1]|nr:hypothetical protein [Arthrospira platensis SPKY1]